MSPLWWNTWPAPVPCGTETATAAAGWRGIGGIQYQRTRGIGPNQYIKSSNRQGDSLRMAYPPIGVLYNIIIVLDLLIYIQWRTTQEKMSSVCAPSRTYSTRIHIHRSETLPHSGDSISA